MDETDIDNIPAIVSLNKFAQKLPPEHRQELYRTVSGFLSTGAMHGVFSGLMNRTGTKSNGDRQDEYLAYLSEKEKQSHI